MHHFLVDVASLRNAHRHAGDDVVLETLRLDALHVLDDTLVGSLAAALVGDLRTTVDRAEDRVHLHEVVILDRLQQRRVRLPLKPHSKHYLQTEARLREHVHDLVDGAVLQQRLSAVKANRQIVDFPTHDSVAACPLKGLQLGEVVGHFLWVRVSLILVDLQITPSRSSNGDILDILIVLVGTAIRASEVATLCLSSEFTCLPESR